MANDVLIGLGMMVVPLILGVVAVIFILNWKRSHRLVVRSPDSNRIIDYFWIIPYLDKKTGIEWWKSVFWQKKIKLPLPPDDCIKINKNGKLWVDVYKLSDSEFIYIKDIGLHGDQIFIQNEKKVSESFKPFSEVQRQTIVSQFARAESSRNKSFLRENAMNLAALIFMMIIIVVFFIYFGDIANAVVTINGSTEGMLDSFQRLVNGLNNGAVDIGAATGANVIVQKGSEKPPQ